MFICKSIILFTLQRVTIQFRKTPNAILYSIQVDAISWKQDVYWIYIRRSEDVKKETLTEA